MYTNIVFDFANMKCDTRAVKYNLEKSEGNSEIEKVIYFIMKNY